MKFDWFKYLKKSYCKSVKLHWLLQWKLIDSTVKIFFPLIQLVIINWFNSEIYFLTGESVKRQITDSISKNLTDSDLENKNEKICLDILKKLIKVYSKRWTSKPQIELYYTICGSHGGQISSAWKSTIKAVILNFLLLPAVLWTQSKEPSKPLHLENCKLWPHFRLLSWVFIYGWAFHERRCRRGGRKGHKFQVLKFVKRSAIHRLTWKVPVNDQSKLNADFVLLRLPPAPPPPFPYTHTWGDRLENLHLSSSLPRPLISDFFFSTPWLCRILLNAGSITMKICLRRIWRENYRSKRGERDQKFSALLGLCSSRRDFRFFHAVR